MTPHPSPEDTPQRWEIPVPMVVHTKTGNAPLTTNGRLHWAAKAKHVSSIRTAVAWNAKAAKIGQLAHITVELHFVPPDRRRRDASNLTATSKPAIDGLVDAGVIWDDTAEWVTELTPVIHEPRGTSVPRLWLSIQAGRPGDAT